ncbi:MAG: hypothetical protein ACR2N3_18125 [Pyrinomonadaceae bacterium]
MDEIIDEKREVLPVETPVETNQTTEKTKLTWKEWLGTDEAARWIYLIFGLCAAFLLMTILQRSTDAICCGDWDGYYHIRWSSLLWENFKHGKWLPEFTWLPLTVLNAQDYADHHFLFHLLQIPFLWFFEPVMAAKVAAVIYGSLAIFSVYWLMFRYRIDYLLLWLVALLTCVNPFFYRMNVARAPPLTIIFTIVGVYLLFECKYVWLAPLMFLFVWTYSLFPLLLIAAIIWAVIIGWNERKLEWQPIAYTLGGMIAGNIINPYFPNNLKLFYEHFVEKIKVGGDFVVPVGGEWYPYSGQELLTHLPIALAAMVIGYVLFAPKNGKLPEKATFFLAFVTILLAAQFRSKRFAEYFPPFAILFAAFSWQAFRVPNILLPEDFRREIEPYLDKKKSERQEKFQLAKKITAGVLGALLFILMIYNFRGVNFQWWFFDIKQEGLTESIHNNEPNTKYQRAMNWFLQNVPEGERIFNCNWDDFPKMFFYDQKHNYVYGLDPNYLYSKNPELSQRISEITGGKVDDAAPEIRDKFGSRYIFSDAKENQDMIAKLLESGWCETAYEDDEAIILKIRDQKGEPPAESKDNGGDNSSDAAQANDNSNANDENANANDKNANQNDDNEETNEQ